MDGSGGGETSGLDIDVFSETVIFDQRGDGLLALNRGFHDGGLDPDRRIQLLVDQFQHYGGGADGIDCVHGGFRFREWADGNLRLRNPPAAQGSWA